MRATIALLTLCVAFASTAYAHSHRTYNTRRLPDGFCYSSRFMGTSEQQSYDQYFEDWLDRYDHSPQAVTQVERNRKYIKKMQERVCSQS